MLPQAVADHYRAQQRRSVKAVALIRNEWAKMGDDLDASWAGISRRVVVLTAAAQLGAARDGAAYVPVALSEQGISLESAGAAIPGAFSGAATSLDGLTYGSLDDLLYGAVIQARTVEAASLQERLAAGGRSLEGLVSTQISDAARMAASTTISATHGAGWVRMVNPPCCQRCAVLAGKFFHSNSGFQRHPLCDCRHVPTTEAKWTDAGVDVKPDQIKDLTKAQRSAIDEGADMNRVINSHRAGKRSDDLMSTFEGAKRGQRRLTPEGIYKVSATREEALERLRDNGYLL
jgi:hypothetical protein